MSQENGVHYVTTVEASFKEGGEAEISMRYTGGTTAVPLDQLGDMHPASQVLVENGWKFCGFNMLVTSWSADQAEDSGSQNPAGDEEATLESYCVLARPLRKPTPATVEMARHAHAADLQEELTADSNQSVHVFLGSTGARKIIIADLYDDEDADDPLYFQLPWGANELDMEFDDEALSPEEWEAIATLEHALHNQAVDAMGEHFRPD